MSREFHSTDFWPADELALSEAREINRLLAEVPRLRLRGYLTPMLLQAILRFSQRGYAQRLTYRGCRIEQKNVTAAGTQVPIRILRPDGLIKGVVLDIHGGGWAVGNAHMNDKRNAAIAKACHVIVVSVNYQLATQGIPIKGAIDDCLAATRWLLSDGLPECRGLSVIIVGESAGAHLAVATLLQLKVWPDLLQRVKGAVLYYGVYDLSGTASVRRAGENTLVLHGPSLMTTFHMLTPGMTDDERRHPPLSPIYGDLQGLPAALMFAGERDPFRDDTVQLANRWQSVADIEAYLVPEAPHGFIHFPTRIAQHILEYSNKWIRERIRTDR